jgi:hypothetical protein
MPRKCLENAWKCASIAELADLSFPLQGRYGVLKKPTEQNKGKG